MLSWYLRLQTWYTPSGQDRIGQDKDTCLDPGMLERLLGRQPRVGVPLEEALEQVARRGGHLLQLRGMEVDALR